MLSYFRSLVPVSDLISRSNVQYQSVDSVHQPNFFPEQVSSNLSLREDSTPVEQTPSRGGPFISEVGLKLSPVGCGLRMDPLIEADSDNEDDPTKLLNQWLGELNTLKKVRLACVCLLFHIFIICVSSSCHSLS